jgi:hypothetical protein
MCSCPNFEPKLRPRHVQTAGNGTALVGSVEPLSLHRTPCSVPRNNDAFVGALCGPLGLALHRSRHDLHVKAITYKRYASSTGICDEQ